MATITEKVRKLREEMDGLASSMERVAQIDQDLTRQSSSPSTPVIPTESPVPGPGGAPELPYDFLNSLRGGPPGGIIEMRDAAGNVIYSAPTRPGAQTSSLSRGASSGGGSGGSS